MKKIFLVKALVLMGILNSCSLDLEPNEVTPETFFNTADEANAGVLSIYQALNFRDYTRSFYNIPIVGAEICAGNPNETVPELVSLDTFTAGGDDVSLLLFFRTSYVGINRANTIIERTVDVDYDPALRDQYRGEALFMRAWHHFHLVRIFGEVPLRLNSIQGTNDIESATRTPIGQIYDSVIDDLIQAIDLLPILRIGGRADKVAAQSLLSKVYLTLASSGATGSPGYEFVSNTDNLYQLASQFSEQVVFGQTDYQFDEDLQQIFNVATRADVEGLEHIFYPSFDISGASETRFPERLAAKTGVFFWPRPPALGFGANTFCNQGLFTTDGRSVTSGFGVYISETSFLDTFDPNDRRRTELIIDELVDTNGNTVWEPNMFLEGQLGFLEGDRPFSAKYLSDCVGAQFTNTRPLMLRFTDILLVYAEAQGPTATGYEAINRVRDRAGLAPLTPGLSVQQFREAVIQERAWELAYEGQRFYDLRRTNSVEEAFTALGQEANLGNPSTFYFYPLPDIELILNP